MECSPTTINFRRGGFYIRPHINLSATCPLMRANFTFRKAKNFTLEKNFTLHSQNFTPKYAPIPL